MGYLYLFYEDYKNSEGNISDHRSIIEATKIKIRQNALGKIELAALQSSLIENEFENLYNIKNNELIDLNIRSNFNLGNSIMHSVDSAVDALKKLTKDSSVGQAINLGNLVIKDIDMILKRGAQAGGLGYSSYSELFSAKERINNILSDLKYIGGGTKISASDEAKKLISKMTSDVESNVGGYMLELTGAFAFLGANYAGLNAVYGTMINIGGHGTSSFAYQKKIDPKMTETLNKIESGLAENNGVQSHADLIFHIDMDKNGNGSTFSESNWVGFQAKNVKNFSVDLRPYSLGEINILNYYLPDFLVNIAGTLVGGNGGSKIPTSLRKVKESASESELDHYWANIKASTKLLGLVDAIGQKSGANITNKINYYVIRSKKVNKIKVISVSSILQKILNYYSLDNSFGGEANSLGVNDSVNDKTKVGSRKDYYSININNFSFEHSPEERSKRAYSSILNKILNTKIQISINFSSWF